MALSDEEKARALERVRQARSQRDALRGPQWSMFSGNGEEVLTLPADHAAAVSDALAREPRLREYTRHITAIVFDTDENTTPQALLAQEPALLARVVAGTLKATVRTHAQRDAEETRELLARHTLTDDELHAFERGRQLTPRVAPPPDGAEALRVAPITSRDLPAQFSSSSRSAPLGVMAPWVGPRISAQQLEQEDDYGAATAHRVMAWPVPALVDRLLVASDVGSLQGALYAFLREHLGALPFRVDATGWGGPERYFHIHTSVIAPPDGDAPMGLELYGRIVGVGGVAVGSADFGLLLRQREAQRDAFTLPGPLVILMKSATYANVRFPSVGVPEYQ